MPGPEELVANISVPFFFFLETLIGVMGQMWLWYGIVWYSMVWYGMVMSVLSSNLRQAFGKRYSRIPEDIKLFISLIQFEVCIFPVFPKIWLTIAMNIELFHHMWIVP